MWVDRGKPGHKAGAAAAGAGECHGWWHSGLMAEWHGGTVAQWHGHIVGTIPQGPAEVLQGSRVERAEAWTIITVTAAANWKQEGAGYKCFFISALFELIVQHFNLKALII